MAVVESGHAVLTSTEHLSQGACQTKVNTLHCLKLREVLGTLRFAPKVSEPRDCINLKYLTLGL